MVKKVLVALLTLTFSSFMAFAQDNSTADNIIGEYLVEHQGESSKVQVTKGRDGSYTARTIWVKNKFDKDGKVRLDEKNPDKALRKTPCDQIVLISGMKYNTDKHRWDEAKIYDPTRGIRANVACEFLENGKLKVKGSLMGFSQTIYWQKIK